MAAYVASEGWVGLRLDVGEVDWDEVKELVEHSYLMIGAQAACSSGPDWRRMTEVGGVARHPATCIAPILLS